MLEFIKRQFTEYRENRKLAAVGYREFVKDIEEKTKDGNNVVVRVSPHNSDQVYTWEVSKKNKLIFKSSKPILRFLDFKNQILMLLRSHGVLAVVVRVHTNQYYNHEEITELWGYRIMLLDKIVILEKILVENLYQDSTTDVNTGIQKGPDLNTVYCGPDGKILGWDNNKTQ